LSKSKVYIKANVQDPEIIDSVIRFLKQHKIYKCNLTYKFICLVSKSDLGRYTAFGVRGLYRFLDGLIECAYQGELCSLVSVRFCDCVQIDSSDGRFTRAKYCDCRSSGRQYRSQGESILSVIERHETSSSL